MIEQRTEAWYEARRGKPTASSFHRIMTSKLKPSTQQKTYLNELMLERIGRPVTKYFENEAMMVGVVREPLGVAMFELATGIKTEEAGFMVSPCGRFGASPDRIWDGGVLELKCPQEKTHLKYLDKGLTPTQYRLQLRGQMMIADKEEGYFCSYHPDHPPLIVKEVRCRQWELDFMIQMESFLSELDRLYNQAVRTLLN